MTCAGQVKIMGGKLNLPFRLPAGQVQFSGLFLTLHAPFLKLHKMPYILVKNHENQTKTKEVTGFFFSLKPEVERKTPAVTIFYSVLILLQWSLIT